MHIAFVSYEYPPETPNGGIATYMQQVARMLHARGHDVEVFAGSLTRDAVLETEGLRIHRVHVSARPEFAARAAPVFMRRHGNAVFDVVEGPDYDADARYVIQQLPALPLVVRLHTPAYLAATLNDPSTASHTLPGSAEEARSLCPPPLPGYNRFQDPAYQHVLQADAITAPSQAIRDVVCRDWELQASQVDVYPNVYQPAPALLELPLVTSSRIVTYLGRLEQRKGVIALVRAVPSILQQYPDVRFQFIGRALASPDPHLDMRAYLERLLAPYAQAVTLGGHVPLESVPAILGEAEVCVFPSLWENFPGVCLEAMAAGRGIVGSLAGGMADMLSDQAGILIAPNSPEQIAQAVTYLLAHPEERMQMGGQARRRVQALYGAAQVGPQQEASYERAIRHRRELGPRHKMNRRRHAL
jgi:glycogen synthase